MCGCLSCSPWGNLVAGDLAHNPGMCLDWELNWLPFGLQVGTQSTEPHHQGLIKNLDIGKSSWIIWMGPKSNHKCPCKTEAQGDQIYIEEEKAMWSQGTYQCDGPQAKKDAFNRPKLEYARKKLSAIPSEKECNPTDLLISTIKTNTELLAFRTEKEYILLF